MSLSQRVAAAVKNRPNPLNPGNYQPMPLPIRGPKTGPRNFNVSSPKGGTNKMPRVKVQPKVRKQVKQKAIGSQKGDYRKVKGGYALRRFSIQQRRQFRDRQNGPNFGGPKDGRPTP